MNPAFTAAYQGGQNFSQSMGKVRDENAIESILSNAMQSGDPSVLQNSIGKILSSVSPERQGAAIKYLENAYQNVQERQKQTREQAAAKEAGYTYGAPPQVAAAQVKERAKNKRISDVYGPAGAPSPAPQNIADEKKRLQRLAGHPDREVSEPAKAELTSLENKEKLDRADQREMRKETLPLRQGYIEAANLARESIRNKTHLMNLIDSGKIDDPTFAIFAESLPYNLGKRLLSTETVEYKGGLVDEFGDLKNIFKGATRVKEVEIYENKLADLYLTDTQKKAILKSRLNAAKVPIIMEESAAEVEEKYPNLSALQFNKKVDEIARSKIDKLFNSVWDEQKAVLDQAEKRKQIPLDLNDPEDKEIIRQILKEANGNYLEAEKLAKKKGYKF